MSMETLIKLFVTIIMLFLAIALASTGIGIPLIFIMGAGVKSMWKD